VAELKTSSRTFCCLSHIDIHYFFADFNGPWLSLLFSLFHSIFLVANFFGSIFLKNSFWFYFFKKFYFFGLFSFFGSIFLKNSIFLVAFPFYFFGCFVGNSQTTTSPVTLSPSRSSAATIRFLLELNFYVNWWEF
jgi:hypothetical protein